METYNFKQLLSLPEDRQKEEFKKMAFLYCDGVGDGLTGPLYKFAAATMVTGLAGSVAAWLLGNIGTTLNSVKIQTIDIQEKMKSVCEAEAETFFLSIKRLIVPGVNTMCANYETQLANYKKQANDLVRQALAYIWQGMLAVLAPTAAGATRDLANRDYSFSLALEAIAATMGGLDTIICTIAKAIETMVLSCSIVIKSTVGINYKF
tara:strand:- start:556 stop:1176 length:621 start_codon:yes stop_codon:yes gene_type:complete